MARSDEPLQTLLAGPNAPKDYSAAELGLSNVSIPAGGTLTGNYVNARGYKRLCLAVTATKTYGLYLLGGVGPALGSAVQRLNTGAQQTTGLANATGTFIFDICNDTIAVFLSNSDAATGSYTVVATLLP